MGIQFTTTIGYILGLLLLLLLLLYWSCFTSTSSTCVFSRAIPVRLGPQVLLKTVRLLKRWSLKTAMSVIIVLL